MSLKIEIPCGIDDLNKLFVLTDFLENKNELVQEFLPEVSKFLVKSTFFTGPFKIRYNEAFDELIQSLIKRQVIAHFQDFTPEDIMVLCDISFLKIITADYYFNPDTYRNYNKEVNYEQH